MRDSARAINIDRGSVVMRTIKKDIGTNFASNKITYGGLLSQGDLV
jgi:hypothetical protein